MRFSERCGIYVLSRGVSCFFALFLQSRCGWFHGTAACRIAWSSRGGRGAIAGFVLFESSIWGRLRGKSWHHERDFTQCVFFEDLVQELQECGNSDIQSLSENPEGYKLNNWVSVVSHRHDLRYSVYLAFCLDSHSEIQCDQDIPERQTSIRKKTIEPFQWHRWWCDFFLIRWFSPGHRSPSQCRLSVFSSVIPRGVLCLHRSGRTSCWWQRRLGPDVGLGVSTAQGVGGRQKNRRAPPGVKRKYDKKRV